MAIPWWRQLDNIIRTGEGVIDADKLMTEALAYLEAELAAKYAPYEEDEDGE